MPIYNNEIFTYIVELTDKVEKISRGGLEVSFSIYAIQKLFQRFASMPLLRLLGNKRLQG